MMDNILEFRNVFAGYNRIQILKGLSFEVERGKVCGVIGPNGSGKTTMFNALIGLIRPRSGKIIFDGEDITAMPPDKRCHAGIGRTFQIPRPFESMSAYENVLVAAVHGAGLGKKQAAACAEEALKLCGLSDRRDVRAGELTLLNRKRLEIARAIGTRPKLLLLDEVAAGLTDVEVRDVMDLVADLKKTGLSIIWVEHIIETMVGSTDKLICMAEGTVVVSGEPKAVIESKDVETLYLGIDDDEEHDTEG